MNKFKKYGLIFCCILLFYSCKLNVDKEEKVSIKIQSPKDTWVYYSNEPILFSTNVKSQEIAWHSSLSGDLGNGNDITKLLKVGTHKISASIYDKKSTITISVIKKKLSTEENLLYNFYQGKRTVYIPLGNYSQMVFSCENDSNRI